MKYTEMIAQKVRAAVESGQVKTLEEWRAWVTQNVPGVTLRDERLTDDCWVLDKVPKERVNLPTVKQYGMSFWLNHMEGFVYEVNVRSFRYVRHPRYGGARREKEIAEERVQAAIEEIRRVIRAEVIEGIQANAEILAQGGEEFKPICGLWPEGKSWQTASWEAYPILREYKLTPILAIDWKAREGRVDILIKREDGAWFMGSYRDGKIEWRKDPLTTEEWLKVWFA